jgi:hypothetical protein
MPYCFRVRFRLRPGVSISSSQSRLVLRGGDNDEGVWLQAIPKETPIKDADELALFGGKFATEADATGEAQRWRGLLEKALAWVNVGADFGDRAPHSFVTKHGRKMLGDSPESPVLNDTHGVMVFECEPRPRFARVGIPAVTKGVQEDRLIGAIDAAEAVGTVMSDRAQLAYDLYSASFIEKGAPDARFAMLMMAVETLIEFKPRPEAVRNHVEALTEQTRASDLPEAEIRSLIGSLDRLYEESISQAGRRLARRLGDQEFMGKKPDRFFTACYKLRGQLFHGAYPRPTRDEVGKHAGALSLFVARLLSLELADAVED